MRRAALASGFILLLAFAATASGAQRKPNLAVKELFPIPSSAKAGDLFDVGGRLINGGDRRAPAQVEVTLRRGLTEEPLAEIGSAKVRVPAHRKKTFSVPVTIPSSAGASGEGIEAGEYVVVACVPKRGSKGKRRCRAAKPPLVIEPKTTPPTFSAGSRTLGDPLLPQIGNGGYDAEHYAIALDYEPDQNVFESATTTMEATATQNLSEFSLDFQDLDVSSVRVNGVPAQFSQVEATPDLSPDPAVTQPMKLVVKPAAGILDGTGFTVEVAYTGEPQVITDPDTSIEGWIPACYNDGGQVCDSNFVVGEPMGSQGWFPSNNYPSDKATFETEITLPDGPNNLQAFGVGELVEPPVYNGDGTWTWSWLEDNPTATYLVTATNGDFDYEETTAAVSGGALPIYNAIDPSATPAQSAAIDALLAQDGDMIDFLDDRFGPYPFGSYGAIFDRAPDVGYALEVQTKSHFASLGSSNGTYLHELAHQWFGNSVTLARWNDIWFNEGWAQFAEWEFEFDNGDSPLSPAQQFQDVYDSASASDWAIAPAVLDGDPANMFDFFPTYLRGAATIEGYREIVGDSAFFDFAKSLQADFAYGNISTDEFIGLATAASGLTGADLAQLEQYFQQWLYGTVKPTLTPADF